MSITPSSNALQNYVSDPQSPKANFTLGRWYEDLGHDAPATSFYIRAAEFAEKLGLYEDSDLLTLAYESLLRASFCINRQKTRESTTRFLLQRAIALAPLRPEAYYLLARFEQNKTNWIEAYMLCSIGQSLGTLSPPLSRCIGYHGPESFLPTLAISSYYLGRGVEARQIFQKIKSDYQSILTIGERAFAKELLHGL